jgi:hypothetical protein
MVDGRENAEIPETDAASAAMFDGAPDSAFRNDDGQNETRYDMLTRCRPLL